MKRGQIYIATLTPRSGSEQQGRRPVLVLSHDSFNTTKNWRSIIVVPISTTSRQGPTLIPLPAGTGGLTKDSSALCHQITTLDRSKLSDYVGTLTDEQMLEVEEGIKAALDMD